MMLTIMMMMILQGLDHTPAPQPPPPPLPSWPPRLLAGPWFAMHAFLSSTQFQAVRVYVRSAFVNGG
jgi:hypothetical protein